LTITIFIKCEGPRLYELLSGIQKKGKWLQLGWGS